MDALEALLFSLDALISLLLSFFSSFLGDLYFYFDVFLVAYFAFSNVPGTCFLNLPGGRLLKAGTSDWPVMSAFFVTESSLLSIRDNSGDSL